MDHIGSFQDIAIVCLIPGQFATVDLIRIAHTAASLGDLDLSAWTVRLAWWGGF